MQDLLQEKCAAADRAEREKREAQAAQAGNAFGDTQAAVGTAPYSPLRSRLLKDLENLGGQHQRSFRAYQILEAHPEFEEFIELLGLIRVDIRFRPIQAQRALVTE